MKSAPKLIRQAAALRAAGHAWEVVAAKLGRPVETIQPWPETHPELWRDAYDQARRSVLAEGEAEAVCVLRRQLRADDDKVRLDAARKLIDCGEELSPAKSRDDQPLSPLARFATHLEGLSDVEIDQLLARLREPRPEDGSPVAELATLPPCPE